MSIRKSLILVYLILFIIPMSGIVYYTHNLNREFAVGTIETEFEDGLNEAVTAISHPLQGSQRLMRVVAEAAAANPKLIRLEEFNAILYSALSSSRHVEAIYVSLEDGYHRTVTRVDNFRRQSDKNLPAEAEWTSSVIEPFAVAGDFRKRKLKYYKNWPLVIGRGQQERNKLDLRTLDHYIAAKKNRELFVGAIVTNPHTGSSVISIGLPIISDNKFIGIVGANVGVDFVENILNENLVTKNSIASIVNTRGDAIMHSFDFSSKYRGGIHGNKGKQSKVVQEVELEKLQLYEEEIAFLKSYLAKVARTGSSGDNRLIKFVSARDEVGYLKRVMLPASVGRGLELIMIAPYSDFIDKVVQNSLATIWPVVIIFIIGLVAIYFYGYWFSLKVRTVVNALHAVHDSSKEIKVSTKKSILKEVAEFQTAVDHLDRRLTELHNENNAAMNNKCVVCGTHRFDVQRR